jgi:NAD(P)-dependent dehydrogenase (short-subunit alcohol dehydrogenase family)
MPSLDGAVVLITGANGGIGTQFVHEALARGAAKVYATARTPRTWEDERIVPLALDVTDADSIRAVVEAAADTTVLINNAGASPTPTRRSGATSRPTSSARCSSPARSHPCCPAGPAPRWSTCTPH